MICSESGCGGCGLGAGNKAAEAEPTVKVQLGSGLAVAPCLSTPSISREVSGLEQGSTVS